MHREHDVSVFSNIAKNIEVDVFFKKSPKNRIVKNWKTSHREKQRIVKKSEHRPPLQLGRALRPPWPLQMVQAAYFVWKNINLTIPPRTILGKRTTTNYGIRARNLRCYHFTTKRTNTNKLTTHHRFAPLQKSGVY